MSGETIYTAVIMSFLLLNSVSVSPCACFRHLELTLCKMLCKFLSHLAQKDILLTLGTHVISKAFVKIKIRSCCCVVGYSTLLWRLHAENHSLTVTKLVQLTRASWVLSTGRCAGTQLKLEWIEVCPLYWNLCGLWPDAILILRCSRCPLMVRALLMHCSCCILEQILLPNSFMCKSKGAYLV